MIIDSNIPAHREAFKRFLDELKKYEEQQKKAQKSRETFDVLAWLNEKNKESKK